MNNTTLTNIFEILPGILREVFNENADQEKMEGKIEQVKYRLMLSIVNNEKNVPTKKCKATIKTGPRRGEPCQAPVEKNGDYCKKHKSDNNMGTWLKEIKRKQRIAPSPLPQ
jgi:hypothetical protein